MTKCVRKGLEFLFQCNNLPRSDMKNWANPLLRNRFPSSRPPSMSITIRVCGMVKLENISKERESETCEVLIVYSVLQTHVHFTWIWHWVCGPSPTIHPSLQAWLTGFERPHSLQDKRYPLFSLINSFSEIWYPILGKITTIFIVFILKGRSSIQKWFKNCCQICVLAGSEQA